ncbi:MAG TPA: nucleoid-structuring protein H-NS [Chryseosolibacter sp.]
MNAIRNSSKLILVFLVLLIAVTGCKSKKKAMEAAAAEKARMEQEAALQKQREEEERKRKEAEAAANAKQNESSTNAKYAVLAKYFDAVATSSNATAANNSINEALTMFASPETPVLIIISGTGDNKDYDRPTTIQKYLNYLKDQKKNANKVEALKFDASGKITEVELRKN